LLCLAIGIAIPVFLIIVILVSKFFSGPAWLSWGILYMLFWSTPLFLHIFPADLTNFSITSPPFAFIASLILDVVIFSLLTYAVLRFLSKRKYQ